MSTYGPPHVIIRADQIIAGDYIHGPDGWIEVLDVVRGTNSVIFKPHRGEPFTLPAGTRVRRLTGA